jgi:hypothetical protein
MSNGATVETVQTPTVASGGVKEARDIGKLKPIGVGGVIVGRSLYEGTLTLPDALATAERAAPLPAPGTLGELDAARFEFAGTSAISSPSHPCPPAGSFPAPRARSWTPH